MIYGWKNCDYGVSKELHGNTRDLTKQRCNDIWKLTKLTIYVYIISFSLRYITWHFFKPCKWNSKRRVYTKKVSLVKGGRRGAAVCPNEDEKYFQNLPNSLYFISFTLAYFQIPSGHICFIAMPRTAWIFVALRDEARVFKNCTDCGLLVEVSSIKFN